VVVVDDLFVARKDDEAFELGVFGLVHVPHSQTLGTGMLGMMHDFGMSCRSLSTWCATRPLPWCSEVHPCPTGSPGTRSSVIVLARLRELDRKAKVGQSGHTIPHFGFVPTASTGMWLVSVVQPINRTHSSRVATNRTVYCNRGGDFTRWALILHFCLLELIGRGVSRGGQWTWAVLHPTPSVANQAVTSPCLPIYLFVVE
jgi:hypothetical protein